jgi:hypothetical protein
MHVRVLGLGAPADALAPVVPPIATVAMIEAIKTFADFFTGVMPFLGSRRARRAPDVST